MIFKIKKLLCSVFSEPDQSRLFILIVQVVKKGSPVLHVHVDHMKPKIERFVSIYMREYVDEYVGTLPELSYSLTTMLLLPSSRYLGSHALSLLCCSCLPLWWEGG
jgi:hypothetical protein